MKTNLTAKEREHSCNRIPKPACGAAVPVSRRVESAAVLKVPLEVALEFFGDPLAVEYRVEFVIDAEAADVDIRRADRAYLGIDADRLGM